jgi:hypothetical protein
MNLSLMERLQSALPDARFVKAFNSVGNARMVNPKYHAGQTNVANESIRRYLEMPFFRLPTNSP